MRLNGRAGQAMACVANGLAKMFVPGVAAGGGVGLSVRKRGWMCASLTAGLGGLSTSGIILGGGANSSTSSSGSPERKGPSRARAGDAGRLPGMGSKVVPFDGAVCITASRAELLTLLVSQLSKGSECEPLSTECRSEHTLRASRLNDGRLMSVDRDVTGLTTCRRESRNDWSECEDRAENVGEGSAPRVELGSV